jgi:hypothetical protein
MHNLTIYQNEIARAVLHSILHDQGDLFTVEIAHGGGARELSTQIEMLLMSLHVNDGVTLLKIAPETTENATARLEGQLRQSSLQGLWSTHAHTVQLGRSQVRFLSPDELTTQAAFGEPTVGLIEVSEAQRIDPNAFAQRIQPIAAASGATTVVYGTPWNGETWFEQLKQRNREREVTDGIRRHFRVTWEQAAKALPGYAEEAERERVRLGEDHPSFQTAYALRPVPAQSTLLSHTQQRALEGLFPRQHVPAPTAHTLASVVVTRLAEPSSAVVTIAERTPEGTGLDVVEHRWLQSSDGETLAKRIAKVAGETWGCEHILIDAHGASSEEKATLDLGLSHSLDMGATGDSDRLIWAPEDPAWDSRSALELIAATNRGGIHLYSADGSPEYRALRREIEAAQASYGLTGLLAIHQPPGEEGFLRGLTLLSGAEQPTEALEPALAS